jgi:hypothetical protein
VSISSDREELERVQLALQEIYDTGQQYQLVGGHMVQNPSIASLTLREEKIRARIMRRRGYAGRIG